MVADYNEVLQDIEEELKNQPTLNLSSINPSNTVLLVIDMTRGFAREGILSSTRVDNIIPNIKELVNKAKEKNIEVIYFGDAHSEDSPEVKRLGKHCMEETSESEIVEELKGLEDKLFLKNSTNGFLNNQFFSWFDKNKENIKNYIVTGCVTDICVYNFATTLRAYLDKEEIESDIYVPINCVETYDVELHDGNLMNTVYLFGMLNYGIQIVNYVK